jgi:leader peptidase (prepilin peptidase)/N-methyltransferase
MIPFDRGSFNVHNGEMVISLIIFFGLLGLVIGSFLNVCIDRIPAKKNLAYPPSHCDACQHPLSIFDNLPVIGYLFLHGKCRYCGAHIPIRVLSVELLTGIMFAFLFWYYGPTWQFGITTIYACVLLTLGFIDLEKGILPNLIIYPMMVIAFIVNVITPVVVTDVYSPHNAILKSLAGGGAGFTIFLIIGLIFPAGMGFGDVKLLGLIGLMVGFPRIIPEILGASIIGGLVAVTLIILGKRKFKQTMPTGPFWALMGFITLIWGNQIIDWYLSSFFK